MRIKLTSIIVDDQDKAFKFYTEVLGFKGSRAFEVTNIAKEHERLKKLGVVFTSEPVQAGPVTIAVMSDTCGNLVQLYQPA